MALQSANTAFIVSDYNVLDVLSEFTVIKIAKTFAYYSGDARFNSNTFTIEALSELNTIKIPKAFSYYSGLAITKTKQNDFYWE